MTTRGANSMPSLTLLEDVFNYQVIRGKGRKGGCIGICGHQGQRSTKRPIKPRTSHVTELLQKAIEWRHLLDSGEVSDQAERVAKMGTKYAGVEGRVSRQGAKPRR